MTPLLEYCHTHAARIRYVLVDIFDTLVLRTVEPEHVKRIVARRLREYFTLSSTAEEIYHLRQRLERRLCLESEACGQDLEFRLEDFLQALYVELRHLDWPVLRAFNAKQFVQLALTIEYEVERQVQYLDESMVGFLRELQQLGIPTSAVTDTYLPRNFLESLLKFHSLDGYFDRIFISNEFMVTKRGGRLYDRVLEQIGTDPQQVLMIGDNKYSDIERAHSRNLQAFQIDRTADIERYQCFARLHAEPATLESGLDHLLADKGPFSEMACTFYIFIARLHQMLVAREVHDIFFLSREGQFLLELFELYQKIHGYQHDSLFFVRSHYLMVSRKSTFIPSLASFDNENFDTLFRQYRTLSLYEFLHSLNFEDSNINTIATELGEDAGRFEQDFPTSDVFFRLCQNETFRQFYETKRTEQKHLFLQYLTSFGVDYSGGLHLVDVGWKGTIQDHIFQILAKGQSTCGYYLGLVDYAKASSFNQKEAVLFDATRPHHYRDLVYNSNRAIYEIFTGASHGSVREYRRNGQTVTAVTDEKEAEKVLYQDTIRPMQERLTTIFEEIARLLAVSGLDLDGLENYFARRHFRLMYLPSRDERNFFKNLYHFENFGLLRETRFHTQSHLRLFQRIANIYCFLRAPRLMLSAGWWDPLTLENMGLSFLIRPYAFIKHRQFFSGRHTTEQQLCKYYETLILELKEGIDRQSQMISERNDYIKKLEQATIGCMGSINTDLKANSQKEQEMLLHQ